MIKKGGGWFKQLNSADLGVIGGDDWDLFELSIKGVIS